MLETPIQYIQGVGPVMAKKLEKMGLQTIEDLLYYFPTRYEDLSEITPIRKIRVGKHCCVCGKVSQITNSRTWQKKMNITEALIEDKTGPVKAVWFNQPFIARNLKKDDLVCLAGKIVFDKNGLFLSSPSYEKVSDQELTHTGRIIPIYQETRSISSKFLRYIIKNAIEKTRGNLPEILPSQIKEQENLFEINRAMEQIHFPTSLEKAQKARERFSFEQLFLIELAVLSERFLLHKEKAMSVPMDIKIAQEFTGSLKFKLTDAQRKSAWQILKDMEKPRPMSRLLEGDVGSGKTVVAVLAILNAVRAGYQTAFMAPTEILVKQHFVEVAKLLRPFKVKIALLTSKQDKIIAQKLGYQTKQGFKPEILEISRNKILEKAKAGEIDLLIGTHSLIQDKVRFKKLAIAVIDEQHRFGIKQRAKLIARSREKQVLIPHLLSMTATPIPRTLALTVYGDLDLSVIDENPKGRKKVITQVVPPNKRQETYQFIREQITKGFQVFIICPRIEEQEKNQTENANNPWANVKAVKREFERLRTKVFPDLKLEMLHGKMKTKEKEQIMENFKAEKFNILVATSVVEVGVDIPKATVMVIEGADRFGLAQLHQFRGRVGRSDMQAYCFLFTDSIAQKTKQRLDAIMEAKNGFELAEYDLKIRGPGSLYGAKQWGLPDLAMQNLTNVKLVEKTRELAKEILYQSSTLKQYPLLQTKLKKFKKQIHFE